MQTTFQFLKKLAQNNSKEWFDANRKQYDTSKAEMESLVKNILGKTSRFDPALSELEAKKCMFRINRDVRFSKNKAPYKSNMGASMNPGGKKSDIPGYYLHIEPGKSFLAGGCWMPVPQVLAAIRQEIDYNGAAFKKILNSKEFKTYFSGLSEEDKLKTAPKGYEKDHPDVELLKLKSFIVVHELKDGQVNDPKFDTYAAKVLKAMFPFNVFLRNCMHQ
jgi:uncharacterized protein (TIGR02453 family)